MKIYYSDYIKSFIKKDNTDVISDYDLRVLKNQGICSFNSDDLCQAILDDSQEGNRIYFVNKRTKEELNFNCKNCHVYSVKKLFEVSLLGFRQQNKILLYLQDENNDSRNKSILDFDIFMELWNPI